MPVQKTENNEPVQKAENNEPVQKAENNEPAQKAENNEPAQKAENNEPIPATENNEPVQKAENNEPVPQAENNEPVQKAEKRKPAQKAEKKIPVQKTFKDLGVKQDLVDTLAKLGYEKPTPVQEASIPLLLEGRDVLSQAQTGTGKTAAFALPILSKIDLSNNKPQALIITPTRELAIQVAEAFQTYSRGIEGFKVVPIYGGQDYQPQLRALKRGPQIVVGTPGRLMDHLRRETLSIKDLETIVLDEADEMLKMGFIDDIEWILEHTPDEKQTALFSATMPSAIAKVAKKYLNNAEKINIKPKKEEAPTIEQLFMLTSVKNKLEALTRYMEVEDITASIIFVRTKNASTELAEKLQARGYAAAALNGDINQNMREKTISRLKKGTLDILVATDVAARGIDVERISHVINYDMPHDIESYTHRIGRTGRAGRKGKALLLASPRETRLLEAIERSMHTTISQIEPATTTEIMNSRIKKLGDKIVGVLEKSRKLEPFYDLVNKITEEHELKAKDIAAALAYLDGQASSPMPTTEIESAERETRSGGRDGGQRRGGGGRFSGGRSGGGGRFSGGRSDERRSGGGRSDERRSGGGRSDERRSGGGRSDERRSGGGRSDERRSGGGRSDERRSDGGRSDERRSGGGRSDERRSGGRPDERRSGGRSDERRSGSGRSDERRSGSGRSDERRSGSNFKAKSGGRSDDRRSSGGFKGKPAGNRATRRDSK